VTNSSGGFELLGEAEDETRLLLHRGCGFSIPIPGHPVVSSEPLPESPRFDVVVRMSDVPITVQCRLDTVPTSMHGEALATSLAQAYAAGRATEAPRGGPVRGDLMARGADGDVSLIYSLPASGGTQQMENLSVTTRSCTEGMWALYQSILHSNQEVNPVKWAHVRSAMDRNTHWDPEDPRATPPSLAELDATLTLLPDAWDEAQAKAADIGPLTDDEVVSTLRLLVGFGNHDNPPTFELHPYILDMTSQHVTMRCPARAADAFLRNIRLVKTMHDYRAWIWQCVWGVGNRLDRGPDQR
jgi:hypothetical protein